MNEETKAINELYRLANKNAEHIEVFNKEMGETRDCIKEMQKTVKEIGDTQISMQTDLDWLKKTYWVIAGASIAGLATGLFNVIK